MYVCIYMYVYIYMPLDRLGAHIFGCIAKKKQYLGPFGAEMKKIHGYLSIGPPIYPVKLTPRSTKRPELC